MLSRKPATLAKGLTDVVKKFKGVRREWGGGNEETGGKFREGLAQRVCCAQRTGRTVNGGKKKKKRVRSNAKTGFGKGREGGGFEA